MEHFAEGGPAHFDAPPANGVAASPIVLCLQDCLPGVLALQPVRPQVETFNLDVGSCVLPCSTSEAASLLCWCSFASLCPPPAGIDKAGRFASWVDTGCVGRSLAPDETLVLTTDGSFDPRDGSAAWALVFSAVGSDGRLPGQFLGCAGGPFPEQFGPASAYLAEVLGLLWASIFALGLPFYGEVLFRADNVAALRGAEGVADMRPHVLCAAANSFHLALRAGQRSRCFYQHVPGHAGDFPNELADGLAGLCCSGVGVGVPSHICLDHWLRDGAKAALWLPHILRSSAGHTDLPEMRHSAITWGLEEPESRLDPAALIAPFARQFVAQTASGDCRRRILNASLVSYNALSLLGDGTGDEGRAPGLYGATGRVALLSASLKEAGTFLAGIQEARTPAGSCQGADFRRLCSGATARNSLGVELWIACGPPWPECRAQVLFADHSRLLARLSFLGLQICVCVAHAPHRGHSAFERRTRWERLTALCLLHGSGSEWIFLLDANCRLGSVVSESVGDWQADDEDDGGALFHSLLLRLQVWLPSTFASSMSGPGGTFLQRMSGELQRCDFVGVPFSWHAAAACIDACITSGHAVPDHFAAAVRCRLALRVGQPSGRAPRIDAAALLDPANGPAVEDILRQAPEIPWGVNVNDHAALLSEYLYQGLSQAFPLKARRMRLSFLSDRTGELHAIVSIFWSCRSGQARGRLTPEVDLEAEKNILCGSNQPTIRKFLSPKIQGRTQDGKRLDLRDKQVKDLGVGTKISAPQPREKGRANILREGRQMPRSNTIMGNALNMPGRGQVRRKKPLKAPLHSTTANGRCLKVASQGGQVHKAKPASLTSPAYRKAPGPRPISMRLCSMRRPGVEIKERDPTKQAGMLRRLHIDPSGRHLTPQGSAERLEGGLCLDAPSVPRGGTLEDALKAARRVKEGGPGVPISGHLPHMHRGKYRLTEPASCFPKRRQSRLGMLKQGEGCVGPRTVQLTQKAQPLSRQQARNRWESNYSEDTLVGPCLRSIMWDAQHLAKHHHDPSFDAAPGGGAEPRPCPTSREESGQNVCLKEHNPPRQGDMGRTENNPFPLPKSSASRLHVSTDLGQAGAIEGDDRAQVSIGGHGIQEKSRRVFPKHRETSFTASEDMVPDLTRITSNGGQESRGFLRAYVGPKTVPRQIVQRMSRNGRQGTR